MSNDDKRPRPPHLAPTAVFEKPDCLRRGRPRPARYSDSSPAQRVIEAADELEVNRERPDAVGGKDGRA